MKKIELLKQPGYIYDLFSLFVSYYNGAEANYGGGQMKAEEKRDSFFRLYGAFPEELLPFFWIKEKNVCFITANFFVPFKERFSADYGLPQLHEALSVYDQTIKKMLLFYFPGLSEEECTACMDAPAAVGRQIKSSGYSAEIKSALYAFFLEPVPAIQKLCYELMVKEFHLSQLYEKKLETMMILQQNFDLEKFQRDLEKNAEMAVDFHLFEHAYVSFCCYNTEVVATYHCNRDIVLLLGLEYQEALKSLCGKKSSLQLDLIGNALAEKNRIDILNLLLDEGELTVRDVESRLGLSGTNAYYHLSLMLKADVVQTRMQGRTVFYSINRQLFRSLCEMLSRYAAGEGGGKERK